MNPTRRETCCEKRWEIAGEIGAISGPGIVPAPRPAHRDRRGSLAYACVEQTFVMGETLVGGLRLQ